MATTPEAILKRVDGVVKTTAGATVAGGEVLTVAGRPGIKEGMTSAASGDEIGLLTDFGPIADFASASATTFSVGDDVWWDASASQAVGAGLAHDGSADQYLGTAVVAKTSGQLVVRVALGKSFCAPPGIIFGIPYEFDCQTGVDTASHVLIPAAWNKNGLVIEEIYGLVTEVFAGTEDQGIVTVSDEDDNALATLTASDAGADAVNDVIEGFFLHEQATGAAVKVVAADKYVDAAVTQVTTGSAAGKMIVYIKARAKSL